MALEAAEGTPPRTAGAADDTASLREPDVDTAAVEGPEADAAAAPALDLGKLPPARNVRIKAASFVKSSTRLDQCPPPNHPEFAVIGRSNVGKSSLINLLTGQKALAAVSKTPGKTTCINHFLINNDWYLVDLPGYGYAKRSKTARISWTAFTQKYFLERETLANVLLLVDASIPPQQADLDVANWLGEAEVPYSLVFTKTDKRKKKCPTAAMNIAAFQKQLLASWEALPCCVATSSRMGDGKGELLAHVARIRDFFRESHKGTAFGGFRIRGQKLPPEPEFEDGEEQ